MTEVVNVPDLDLQFFGNDGKPMASGHVVFFRNGTDIPESVYTSDGETALGNTIELDASGFPNTQFSLKAGQLYTVKAFDSDDVLIWTRNDISGSSEGGGAGNWVPMEGNSADDPITGPLVWKEEQEQNSVSKTGVVLTNSQGGQTTLTRDGLEASIANTTGSHLYNKARIQNTQNGFPGYPDFAEMDIRNLKLHREVDDNGSRKEKSLNLSVDSSTYNTIESKGSHLNVSCDKSFIVQAPSGVVNLMGQNIELTPANNQFVYINNNGTLRTQWLSLGNNNYHQDVSEIYTSTSTGQPSDYQLITAKAAYDMAQGGGEAIERNIQPFDIGMCDGSSSLSGVAVLMFAQYAFTPKSITYFVNGYVPGTRTAKVAVYDSSGKICWTSGEKPLVNKMNTWDLTKDTTYVDKEVFNQNENFYIAMCISSGTGNYEYWRKSNNWYGVTKWGCMSLSWPMPDMFNPASQTKTSDVVWLSLTVTPVNS